MGSGLDFNIEGRLDASAKSSISGQPRRHRTDAPADATLTQPHASGNGLQP